MAKKPASKSTKKPPKKGHQSESEKKSSRGPVLILLAIIVLVGGWWWWSHRETGPGKASEATPASHPRRPADLTVPELASRATGGQRVIFVGLDGADWSMLDELIKAGTMPNLKALRDESVWGQLTSETPMLSPLVWTTMMTGASPLDHRILDFVRVNPETGRTEPIPSSERARPAIWNMASMAGKSVGIFGLWATWPAEPVRGELVTDRLVSFLFGTDTRPQGLAYPPSEQERAISTLHGVEQSVGFDTLHRYLPWLTQERYQQALQQKNPYADPVGALRRILIQTDTYGQLGLDALESDSPPDLSVIYFEGTDSVGHAFAKFLPPLMNGISAEDSSHYKSVPAEYFAHVDDWLGRLVEIAKKQNAALVIASDHGFKWNNRPPLASSSADRTAALWHEPEGIYLLHAPGVQPRHLSQPAGGVRQICATLLDLLGLPAGGKVAGPPLPGAPTPDGQPADYLAHYRRPPEPRSSNGSEAGAQQELAKLQALGYLGSNEPSSSTGQEDTLSPGALNNMATLLKEAGRTDEALATFRRALDSTEGSKKAYLWSNYSNMLHEAGRDDEAKTAFLKTADIAQQMLEKDPGDTQLLLVRANAFSQAGHYSESADAYQKLIDARPERALFRVEQARALEAAGRWAEAKRNLEKAHKDFPRSGDIAYALAQTLLTVPDAKLKNPKQALDLAVIVFRAAPDAEHGVTVARALDQAGQGAQARDLLQHMLAEAKQKGKTEDVPVIEKALRGLTGNGGAPSN